MNYYQFMVPRLNGKDIGKRFNYYHSLVRKGIAGFIIFGGRLETIRKGIRELQKEAKGRLIIASDLEQGLGQQIEGGTLFPPAMGIAEALKGAQGLGVRGEGLGILKKIFKAVAVEARYAGINTIFAPVLDINTNPRNPIISTRAFGEDHETVSFFGCEMIKVFQSNGVIACGKHFPGHGDTKIDSHIKLPVINKDMRTLQKHELLPFKKAIEAGVKMIMLGHLKVPALDASGIPVSLSKNTVKYLRNRLGFKGKIITDAMNMGGIGKYSEEEASLMALKAGVDIILHPTDPDRVVPYLEEKLSAVSDQHSVKKFFGKKPVTSAAPNFEEHKLLSDKITKMAIKVEGRIMPMKKPLLVMLGDDAGRGGRELYAGLKKRYPSLKKYMALKDEDVPDLDLMYDGNEIIVAVFSKVKAWKGGSGNWLLKAIKRFENRADIFISFGSPYLLDGIKGRATKIYAYWDSGSAQRAVAACF